MECQKCRGLMVRDLLIDVLDDTGNLFLKAWRCINCGNILDPTIMTNRQGSRIITRPRKIDGSARNGPQQRRYSNPVG